MENVGLAALSKNGASVRLNSPLPLRFANDPIADVGSDDCVCRILASARWHFGFAAFRTRLMKDMTPASFAGLGTVAALAAIAAASSAYAGDVTGIVTAPDGSPVSSVPVELGDLFVGATTDADGSFTISDVPAGE